MKKFCVLNLMLLFFFSGNTQNVRKDLLVCHVEQAANTQQVFRQKIFAYHFVNGTYSGRDEVMQFDGKKNGRDYIRTDRGQNILYKNRFLITGIGNIVDLQEKKILFDGRAELVKISNDSVIYYTNDAFKGKFYSVYNFKTMQYGETKDLLFKALLGRDIEFDKTVKPFKLNYYPQGKSKVELSADAGYGQQNTRGNKYVPDPPVYWLSDSVFIYPKFNLAGTEIQLQKVYLDSKRVEDLYKASISSGITEARWVKKNDNEVKLICNGSEIHVDLKKNVGTCPLQSQSQSGFNYVLLGDNKGRSVLYKGKEIGKFNFDTDNFAATENLAVIIKLLIVGNESYQQGMQFWGSNTQSWQAIDAEEVTAVLGWIDPK